MEGFTESNSFNYLQTVLATSDGIALFLNTDLTVINCTPRAARLLKIAATDYEQPLANFESVIGYPSVVSDARQVLASLEPVEQRIELRPNKHYRIRILPHTNGEGEAEGLVINFRRANQENIEEQTRLEQEVTQRKQAEADLRQSRLTARNRLAEIEFIYNTAPVGLCVLDTEFRYVRINERLAEINGLSVEDHLGKTVREIVPDLADEAEAALQQIIDSGEPILGLEIKGETPAQPGVERVWLENWLPYKNQQGEVMGINIVAEEVTEQRKIQQAAQESEERYTQLFTALDDGFCVCQMLIDEHGVPYDYQFLEINPAFETHTGLKNALGTTAYTLIPNLEKHWLDTYTKVALAREPIRFEQGSAEMGRWFDVYAFPFGPTEQKKFAIQFKDITLRKQAEEVIRTAKEKAEEQEQKLRDLFEQAPVGISILSGSQFEVELVNPGMSKLWGKEPAELLGKPIFEGLTESRGQGFEELLSGVLQSGESFIGNELPVTLKRQGNLETVYFNFVYHPWSNESGQINSIIVVATEVTEQVLARQQVEASEQRFRILLNSIPQMTWTNLPDGYVNFYSNKWFSYIGLDHEQIEGQGWKAIVHPDDLDGMLKTYLQSLKTGREFVHENRLKQYDGNYRWHLNRSLPLRDDDGQITLWVGTSTDIHEQKLTEEELQQTTEEMEVLNEELASTNEELIQYNEELSQTNQQLTQVNSDLDNFVYMASHDLKTPISNIEGLVNALKRSLTPDQTQSGRVQRLLEMMQTSVNRFKSTLTELAQIARLQREAAEEATPIWLQQVLEEVQLDLAMPIEQAKAQIDTNVANCPPVKFSAKNLRSVVYNLLSNAVKYRSPDRPLRISVTGEATSYYLILSVADNGLGMETINEQKVFGMFQRLHDHVEGTGVGLYITKKIMDNAGGKIEVASEEGVGTTFKVYFPRQTKQ